MHCLSINKTIQPRFLGPLTTSTNTGKILGLNIARLYYPSTHIQLEDCHSCYSRPLAKHGHFIGLGPHFTAPQVAEIFVHEIVHLHNIPISLISDQDPIFMSQFWRELFRLQGIKLSMSSAYHPQSDGKTE